jgi:hypothetical protein
VSFGYHCTTEAGYPEMAGSLKTTPRVAFYMIASIVSYRMGILSRPRRVCHLVLTVVATLHPLFV